MIADVLAETTTRMNRAVEAAKEDFSTVLGANPTNDGNLVRVTMPELTAERRKEYVKLVKSKAEDAKVHVRGIRRKAKDELDALKSELGEDEIVRAEKELDSLTRQHVELIDDALKRKEAELLEV
ncbi:MAG: ribosome recycling factor [Microbacterium sp.]|uniref:ribosome-recycling factor n=1 Tax=Microbacterium sp. TaxID=51671 RepID=UPI00262E9DE7|nr:ribosome-recycling factor [Microbacterium sp.]MDF2559936.1 ribosome recycling factor [Microbacterium sp.]